MHSRLTSPWVRTLQTGALLVGALALGACSGSDDPADAGTADTGTNNNNNNVTPDSGVTEMTLYERLGEQAGIQTVIEDFVGRVVGDPAINGYFLNANVSGSRVITCLVKQVGALTGGPQTYPAEGEAADADGCRNMTDAHAGMGVSTQDFTDLAGHLVAALDAAGVPAADRDIVIGAVAPLSDIIVEDADDNATIYQRVGRKPAISAVVGDFVGRVLADPAINGYFLNDGLDAARLGTCLVRQVCGLTGGPCVYGEGVEAELNGNVCKDMTSTHNGMGISAADYGDLATHLVGALTDAGVMQADIDAITTALTDPAFVSTIVEDADSNATIYQRVGRKPAIGTVIGDFVGRVLADPAINGYFLNSSLDAGRLGTCLIRQVCDLTGGPCVYGAGVEAELNGTACRDMTASHTGMGVSAQDFGDLAGHLVGALTDAGVAQADIDAIAAALTDPAFVSTIVEDADNNATVYQRVGRKPAIGVVVDDFIVRVVGDSEINGFFTMTDAARLSTCLVRQVCSIDGPCRYGEGVEAALNGNPCRDMVSSHAGMVDDQGAGISLQDFSALAGHLVAALDGAGVAASDRDAIIGAIAPLCSDIIADPTQCPN